MFTISTETHFCASHQLTLPDGSKEPAHEHNWTVTAKISSNKLNNIGIVMDFQKFKALLDKIVAQFENTSLEKLDYFKQNNPSAENVSKYIYDQLKPQVSEGLKLQSISVVEEPGFRAKYSQ